MPEWPVYKYVVPLSPLSEEANAGTSSKVGH